MPGTQTRRTAIDWAELRRRLENAQRSFEQEQHIDTARRREILLQRANRIATPPETAARQDEFDILAFSLAHEAYGIELRYIRAVVPLRRYTPLPSAPAFVVGIINRHGEILSVIDIKRFFDLPDGGLTDLNKVIVLQDKGMEFGILADAIDGIRTLSAADIQAPLPNQTGLRGEFSRGIAPGPLMVLNAERMLKDKTLTLGNGNSNNT